MILVSVGTTGFGFDRLIKAVDQALIKLKAKDQLIVQLGATRYTFKYPRVTSYQEVAYKDLIKLMKTADKIICAGGPATIYQALSYGQDQPLVIPRSGKFKEHVDEHEVEFVKFFGQTHAINIVLPNEELISKISQYVQSPKCRPTEKLMADSRLITKLIGYTDAL